MIRLSPRFSSAVEVAREAHLDDVRKGTDITAALLVARLQRTVTDPRWSRSPSTWAPIRWAADLAAARAHAATVVTN